MTQIPTRQARCDQIISLIDECLAEADAQVLSSRSPSSQGPPRRLAPHRHLALVR